MLTRSTQSISMAMDAGLPGWEDMQRRGHMATDADADGQWAHSKFQLFESDAGGKQKQKLSVASRLR